MAPKKRSKTKNNGAADEDQEKIVQRRFRVVALASIFVALLAVCSYLISEYEWGHSPKYAPGTACDVVTADYAMDLAQKLAASRRWAKVLHQAVVGHHSLCICGAEQHPFRSRIGKEILPSNLFYSSLSFAVMSLDKLCASNLRVCSLFYIDDILLEVGEPLSEDMAAVSHCGSMKNRATVNYFLGLARVAATRKGDAILSMHVASMYRFRGQYDRAVEVFQQTLEIVGGYEATDLRKLAHHGLALSVFHGEREAPQFLAAGRDSMRMVWSLWAEHENMHMMSTVSGQYCKNEERVWMCHDVGDLIGDDDASIVSRGRNELGRRWKNFPTGINVKTLPVPPIPSQFPYAKLSSTTSGLMGCVVNASGAIVRDHCNLATMYHPGRIVAHIVLRRAALSGRDYMIRSKCAYVACGQNRFRMLPHTVEPASDAIQIKRAVVLPPTHGDSYYNFVVEGLTSIAMAVVGLGPELKEDPSFKILLYPLPGKWRDILSMFLSQMRHLSRNIQLYKKDAAYEVEELHYFDWTNAKTTAPRNDVDTFNGTNHNQNPPIKGLRTVARLLQMAVGAPRKSSTDERVLVYCSRKLALNGMRSVVDEDELVEQLQRVVAEVNNGSELEYPWKLEVHTGEEDMDTQGKLFARADIVFLPYGGAAANLLFARPGTHVVEVPVRNRAHSAVKHMALASGLTHWELTDAAVSYHSPFDIMKSLGGYERLSSFLSALLRTAGTTVDRDREDEN